MAALGVALAGAVGVVGAPGAHAAGGDALILASGMANSDTYPIAVSDGGRRVLFSTTASNLDGAVDGQRTQLYVYDRPTGAIRLVSRATGPAGAPSNPSSYNGGLTPDGRLAVFVGGFGGGAAHVYVRDLERTTTTLVDRATNGDVANDNAYNARISADGRYVAFSSFATNLGGSTSGEHVYVRDLRTGVTTQADRADGPNGPRATSIDSDETLAFSADGRHVAFASRDRGLTPDVVADPVNGLQLYVRDLDAGRTELVSRPTGTTGTINTQTVTGDASLSADGRHVAFSAWGPLMPGIPTGIVHVYVRDRVTNTTTLVDRADGAAGAFSGSAVSASMSADGRGVAFGAYGGGMVPDATVTGWGSYVRDVAADRTRMASRAPGPGGPAANADARYVKLSPDGRAAAFASSATNLLPGVEGSRQVFVRTLTGDAPEPVAAPAITGRRRLGEPLRCTPGTWANDAPAFTYTWLRDGTPIAGAASDTYIATAADLDLPLTCRVTATNAGGTATADSAPTTVPTPPRDGVAGPAGPAGTPGAPGAPGAAAAPSVVAARAGLAVALADARRTVARNRTLTLRYATTGAARLTLTAARRGKATRLTTTAARRAGRGTIKVKVKLGPGSYRLTLTAADGARQATDALTLTVRR